MITLVRELIYDSGFVIKPEKWDSDLTNFSLSMAFCPSTGLTCGVLHMLLKSELEFIVGRLEALKHIAWHPLLLPMVLMELRTESIPKDLRYALYRIEKTTGTHKNY